MEIPKIGEVFKAAQKILGGGNFFKAMAVNFFALLILCAAGGVCFFLCYFTIELEAAGSLDGIIAFCAVVLYTAFCGMLSVGMAGYFVNLARGSFAGPKDIVSGFKRSAGTNALIPFGYCLVVLPMAIFMVLLAVIMCYKGVPRISIYFLYFILIAAVTVWYIQTMLKYSMVMFIAGDSQRDKFAVTTLFRVSEKMTMGYKKRIFCLCFIMWLISGLINVVMAIAIPTISGGNAASPMAFAGAVVYVLLYLVLWVYFGTCMAVIYDALVEKYYKPKEREKSVSEVLAMYDDPEFKGLQ